jgi:hypothetical protein
VQLVADLRALAIARTGASEAELAPLLAFVEDSDILYRLHAGETVTAEELYDRYTASRDEASDESPRS